MQENQESSSKYSKKNLYVIAIILLLTTIFFRAINEYEFEQTSILFIGLPFLVTILTIRYYKTPKTAYGIVFKVITIFLLLSSILLGEGTICVLMAAPIFYGVAALTIYLIERFYKKGGKDKLYSFILIPAILTAVFQPSDYLNQSSAQSISTTRTVNSKASIDQLDSQFKKLDKLPFFLKIGFPKPLDIIGEGTEIGDKRTIRFRSSTKGVGILTLLITQKTDTSITFKTIEDRSHINHWLNWEKVQVSVKTLNNGKTKITWNTNFKCVLGPSWYFVPIENYAVGIMNNYLISLYFG